MEEKSLQVQLFELMSKMPDEKTSMVDRVASLLSISRDSAYRRIRNEKMLSLEEVAALCKHYQISLDALLNVSSNTLVFKGTFLQPATFKFENYLHNIIQQVQYMSSFSERRMYQLCKDIPVFHHFYLKPIAAFKHYFWMKTILQHPDYKNKKFKLEAYSDELFALGQKALHFYNKIDSVEIWTIETFNSTIRQIEFYRSINAFSNQKDVVEIYIALEKLLHHLEEQAVAGQKFSYDESMPQQKEHSFQLYYNEVILGDNSIISILDNHKTVYLIHSVFNFMITQDPAFCDAAYANIQNLIKNSTLISEVSERERARFFKHLKKRIALRRDKVHKTK